MYIYLALINALSAHIIQFNLNMIFYTNLEHSLTKNNLHKVLYGNTHTHTQSVNSNVHDTDQYHTSYMLNAELSPKRYWRGPRSQEVEEEGEYT